MSHKLNIHQRLRNSIAVIERGMVNAKTNTSLIHTHAAESKDPSREQMSERAFVRAFGDKVVGYRLSNRPDFVGLLIYGKFEGILITEDKKGRKVRLVDVDEDKRNIHGHITVTKRYLRVRRHDSVSNMQRGLLRYVR